MHLIYKIKIIICILYFEIFSVNRIKKLVVTEISNCKLSYNKWFLFHNKALNYYSLFAEQIGHSVIEIATETEALKYDYKCKM